MNLFGKYFKTSLLFISFALILSFVSYFFPLFNKVAFFVILGLTLILTLEKLEYGLYILLAELFIGSKGYLFYFDAGGTSVSLRIALFLIVMGVWFAKHVIARTPPWRGTKQSPEIAAPSSMARNDGLMKWYWILFAFIAWGFIWGLIRGNSFQNLFFDFNGWLYFALIFPLMDVIKSRAQIENILQIFAGAVTVIIIKTFFFLYIFSHGLEVPILPIYRWLRQFLIGEITLMPSGFYRIFFQSQIYLLIGFFIFSAFLIWRQRNVIARTPPWRGTKQSPNDEIAALSSVARNDRKIVISYWLLVIGSLTSVLVSFSRSFWVGLAVGILALLIFLIFFKFPFKKIVKIGLSGIAILVISLATIFVTAQFPFPEPRKISFSSMFSDRLTDLDEAAVRSRWDLLPPLGQAIIKHPIIGSGFGTTVTYKSSDPRAVQINPGGMFTTYAFEWGFLDIMLKIGLAGLVVYLLLIAKIWRFGWGLGRSGEYIAFGFLLGLAALLATNFFSPYLNHPLGIGYIILSGIFFQKLEK